jgi:hypothetical protein
MTRGNPRPGQQRMPDRSDAIERLAHKEKAATTDVPGTSKDPAAEAPPAEPRDTTRRSGKGRPRTPKRSPKAGT